MTTAIMQSGAFYDIGDYMMKVGSSFFFVCFAQLLAGF
jgi:hypothetical protein